MIKKAISVLALVFIISLSFNVNTVSSSQVSNTLYVGGFGPENYSSIQSAINDANEGCTIYVYNGTYYENILIDKPITLTGEDKNTTVIDGSRLDDVLTIKASYTTIQGFTIQNGINGTSMEGQSWYNIIKNNIIKYNLDNGVQTKFGCYWNTISRNFIAHNKNSGYCSYGGPNYLFRNKIIGNNIGFRITGSIHEISNNLISHNQIGIFFSDVSSSLNEFFQNEISHNVQYGILTAEPTLIRYDLPNKFINNNFLNNFNRYYFYNPDHSSSGWHSNYWDCWLGNHVAWYTGPYFIRGAPYFDLSFLRNKVIYFNIDWNPASEPYDIDFGGME